MPKSAIKLAGSALALLIMLTGTTVYGATYTVSGSGYPSISAAITAASANDTVLITYGIYEESFSINKSLTLIGQNRPIIRYNGIHQPIASYMDNWAMINFGGYGPNYRIENIEFDGINSARNDTCLNLIAHFYSVEFHNCIFHGTKGYLFRSNRAASAFDCEFYGPANTAWRVLRPDSVVNCRIHHITGSGLGNTSASNGVFQNNVIYECGTAIYSRGTHDNVYKNNLVYHCRNGFYAAYLNGDFDPSLRPSFINNTFVLNQRHGIRFSGKDNAIFKNNIVFWNGLEDTSAFLDLFATNNNKPGWDITYNCIGRYSDSLDNTFADSLNCIGNVFNAPLFADTAVGDTNNGFYLLVHSPAIDAGNQGIRDPDGSPSDMGCYGGPEGRMKAPEWLANLGSVTQTAGASDNVTWPQYDVPGNFSAYMVYHDTTTTAMRYTVGPENLVDSVTNIATTGGTYPHVDDTWYRVSVAGDSTGYLLGGGYTENDTVMPQLLAAYYYSNGTRYVGDDELRLVFNEGLLESGVNLNAPGNYLAITGSGAFANATISSVNEFVVDMDSTSTIFSHNRTWISVRPDSLHDYYGNAVVGSVEVTTFNVRNLDNNNDFETISLAVANATTDDFIEIYDDGYYYEQVDLNLKQITLQADSLANPVINGQGVRDYGVQVTADSVRVVGIRCDSAAVAGIAFSGTQGGWAVLDTCTASPAGILCINGCSDVVVRRSVAYGNVDGIRAFNSTNTHVVNNISRDNTDDGIVSVNSASIEIRNNVCYANAGDGVETSGGGSGTVSNMAMLSNSVDLNNSAGYTAANNYTALTAAFTDTAANDFTLQQASPLWGAGENNENIGRYEGRVWRKGVSTKYHHINNAYGAAADDETLLVCPGRYYETLDIDKGVTILADSGSGHALVHSEYPYRNNRNDLQWNVYQTTAAVSFNLDGFIVDGENANVGNDNAGWGSDEHYGMLVLNGRISNVTLRNLTHYGHNYIPYGIRTGNGGRVVLDSCRAENAGYLILAGSGTHTARYCTFDSTASGLAVEGDRDTVRNCIFGPGNMLRMQADPDFNVVHNNLVDGGSIRYALTTGVQLPEGNRFLNNTIIGADTVMRIYGHNDTLINNIIMGGAFSLDIRGGEESNTRLYYNNITGTDATNATAIHWNMVGASFEEPLFADSANGDFYLKWNSPMIDRGDLRICDPDDGRSDIGAYGGHAADTLAPARLDSFTTDLGVLGDNDNLVWDWNGNDPGDFKHYAIYRDTTGPNFQPDTSNLLDTITNVATKSGSYADNGKSWFYKISAVDTNLYGGGYALFDTVAPWIDTAIYYCNGTPGLGDDTLVVVMSEWIIDMTDHRFDSTFRVIGLGSGRNATIGTGNRVNDDTLIVTGFDTVFCRLRTRLDFSDTNVADYIRNLNGSSEINVTTYNVGIQRTGADYETINDAYAAAIAGDSILIVDAGVYPETLGIDRHTTLVGYGISYSAIDSLPVLLDPGTLNDGWRYLITATAACSVYGLKMVSTTDSVRAVFLEISGDPFMLGKCILDGNGVALNGIWADFHRDFVTIDSCDISGYNDDALFFWHNDVSGIQMVFTGNTIHDISGGHALFTNVYDNIVFDDNTVYNVINNSGAVRFTGVTNLSVRNNLIYNCGGGGDGTVNLDWDASDYVIDGNTIYNCSDDDGAIFLRHAYNGRITNNFMYNCHKGLSQWSAGSPFDSCSSNIIAFNTVARCTLGGISVRSKVSAPDTVIGNIAWGNGAYDLTNIGNAVLEADYNWFTGGANINWPRGPESDSGYPLFMDTTALDYRLQIASPCLNFTGYETPAMAALGIDTVDLYGTVRANPSYSYWDAGAYEGGGGPPRVDSVEYWACGTDSVGDDTMKVWFRRINVDAGSVPTGAGQAGNAFGFHGYRGSMAGATAYLPGGGDTNIVVVRMANSDTVPSRWRDALVLRSGVIAAALDAAPALADTDTVITWNVYDISNDTPYRTIFEAVDAGVVSAGDTVMVFDDGYYTDTLRMGGGGMLTRSGTNRPQVRYNGAVMTDPAVWRGNNLLIWAGDVVIDGIVINAVNIAETDTNAKIYMSNGTVRSCSLVHMSTYFDSNQDSLVNNSFDHSGLYYRGSGAQIIGNRVDSAGGDGISFYNGVSALVKNNVVNGCGGNALYQRNANNNRFVGNIFSNCPSGFAISQSGGSDLSHGNVYRNNVFYGNGQGAYLDSAGTFENNILYGNGVFQVRLAAGAAAVADSIRYNMLDSANTRMGALLAHPGNVVTGIDPLFADGAGGDFHLAVHSPAIDRGDTAAAAADYDGGRNDMGAYGGPTPIDTLHPHRLDTLSALSVAATGYGSDTLSWKAYMLDDYKFFAIYRGLDGDFVPAETNCIDSIFNIAALGARYTNDGQAYVYKVSAVDSVDYGGGYQSATYARIFLAKTTHQTHTIPGDTMTYAVYYDNDGEIPTADTFEVVDGIPANTVYIDTLNGSPHTGGVIDVDWYDGAWQEDEPADPATVQAIRWQIAPAIGAHTNGGDASGADDGKTGIDTTGGDDAGTVYFRVRVR